MGVLRSNEIVLHSAVLPLRTVPEEQGYLYTLEWKAE